MTTTNHSTISSSTCIAIIRSLLLVTIITIQFEVVAQAQQWTTSGNNIYNTNTGNVGIGTTSPSVPLFVQDNDNNWLKTLLLYNTNTGGNAQAGIQMTQGSNTGYLFQQGSYYWLWNAADGPMVFVVNGAAQMVLNATGNLGIGTGANPASRLHVAGDVTVDGNISAKYQDVAEWVPASEQMAPGTVVILDSDNPNSVVPSARAYDPHVAGVVSSAPGLILGEGGEHKVKVATTGRVKVRVDASQGPVRIGDLLVTSDREGFAMRSEPVSFAGIEMHRPGTLIGKALEPLSGGEGEILVLLSLQ